MPFGDDEATSAIAFFAHDSSESTVVKRATTFQLQGREVIGFMFKRLRPAQPRPVTWQNVELGVTVDLHYLQRLPKLLGAVAKVIANRSRLRRCSVLYARNIDMLLLAVLLKPLARPGAAVVYEVLDIPRAVLGSSFLRRAFRRAERFLINNTHLLVVSSPDFMTQYYLRYLNYKGPWYLLENKVSTSQIPANAIGRKMRPPAGPPWIVGWFGTLRCERSIKLLNSIARTLGERIRVHIRGLASEEYLATSVIKAAAEHHPNITYFGPYASPHDLPAIYGQVHFTWCIDYLDVGANSDWLLPNRLYEGGLMGSVALARKHTATGCLVDREGLGFTLDEPVDRAVIGLLNTLSAGTYTDLRSAIEKKDQALFLDVDDTRKLLEKIDVLVRD